MGLRILVVDDEDTVRMVISQVLQDDGHEVVEAATAEEALEHFRKQPFPLIMTDIYMGKMTGLELLEEIKLVSPEALVVVMTSNASLETATTALRNGAYDYLNKPFEDIELISALVNRASAQIRLVQDNTTLITKLQRNAEELQELNGKLKDMADRDGLTGLFNHRYFRAEIEREVQRSSRTARAFSLLFLDIDHFKHYNDTHGHLAGDELLRQLARILDDKSRRTSLPARYGGEEFVVLLPEIDKDGARVLAERLRETIETYPFQGREAQPTGSLTVSLGVASYPEDGTEATQLIEHADKALYAAKSGGRNGVCCWEGVLA